jgi:uncharacterized repeat protein (TIGR02543 family)
MVRIKGSGVAVLITALLLFAVSAYGRPVDFGTAENVAKKLVERKRGGGGGGGKIRRGSAHRTAKAFTPYYVFEKDGGGFVIVSADDVAAPVLGEVDRGVFNTDSMPPALIWLLGTYERQIEDAVKGGVTQDEETGLMWEESAQGSGLRKAAAVSYPTQLISTTWNQGTPYNLQTPYDGSSRSVTGCVATAMAQIIKYHGYPSYGTGASEAYYTRTKNIYVPSVDFNTYYDYANMVNNYPNTGSGTTAQRNAVSTLMYHSGAGAKMNYTSNGSGAYSSDAATALARYFGYDNSIRYVWSASSNISVSDWKDLVVGQIENNSPIYYAGSDENGKGAHAFIIDGYDGNNNFHLNWGWGGSCDGFFPLTALNPSQYKFNNLQEMIINIMPNQNGNPPSQIKVSGFDVSATQTAVSANITAKMYYGSDFSGKIGFAVMSGGTVGKVLDSADYSISTAHILQSYGVYAVNYESVTLSKQFGSDMPSGNLTLQVVTKRDAGAWAPVGETRSIIVPYPITYNLSGGINHPSNPAAYNSNGAITLQAPSKAGCIFGGWFADAFFTGTAVTSIPVGSTGNKVFYAKWIQIYTVAFNAGGGTVTPASDTTGAGGTLASLPVPERTGYTFGGWFTASAADSGTAVTTGTVFSGNATVYARWVPVIYTLACNLGGGTVEPDNPAGYTIETASFTLNNPSRLGYTFAGWTGTNGAVPQTTVFVELGGTGNKNYTANWTLVTYAITYDLDSGTVASANPTGYTVETAAFTLNNPTKPGDTFVGWTGTNGTVPQTSVSVERGSMGDRSYTANWVFVKYIVRLDAGGGTVSPASDTTGPGGRLASLPTPTRTGFAFDGWHTAEIGGTEVTESTVFSADTVIYARWTPVYTITFDAGGGTVSPASDTTGFGGRLASLPTPARTGFAFDGWHTAEIGGTEVTESTVFSADAVIYARWTLITYTVTFDANGGTVTIGYSATGNGWTLASLPMPARIGYTFSGWFTERTGGSTVTESTVLSADAVIYARWTLITHTVMFDANGGTVTTEYSTTGNGWTLASLPMPARTGYIFSGWFTDLAGGTAVTESTVFNADAVIYARWAIITYTVTFDANGGTVSPASGITGEGWAIADLPTPTRTGYTFSGWFTTSLAAGGTGITTGTVFNANAVIYARWKIISYAVVFDANGGMVNTEYITTGTDGKLAYLPTPIRDGYVFDGWFTWWTGGVKVTTGTMFGKDTTVYARWMPNAYKITFVTNINGTLIATVDGSPISTGTPVQHGKSVVFIATPNNGYTVGGWKLNGAAVADTIGTYILSNVSAAAAVTVSFEFEKTISVASSDRTIPTANPDKGAAVVSPVPALSAEFTAGPNPVGKSSGVVKFFRQGSRIASAPLLVIYDVSGNAVKKVGIADKAAACGNDRRAVGSWNLKDAKGRPVPEGTYVVKGTVKTANGKREKVSVVVGVR